MRALILLILPMMLGARALQAQAPYGTVVTAVEIDGGPPGQLEGISIQPGDTLDAEAVSRAIQELYNAGGYGRIEAVASDDPGGGTRLVFRVDQPYFFSTVQLIPRTLFDRSLSSYVRLPYGQRFSRNGMNDIVADVGEQLRADGYFESRIVPSYELDPESRLARVTLSVEPGPRARVRSVQFTGPQQTFTGEELSDALNLDPGSAYRLERLLAGAERIRAEFAQLRFLNTDVVWRDPVESYDPENDAIDLVLEITPGPLALVQLQGYEELSDDELRALVPIYEEGRIDDDLIEEGRANILDRLYRDGFYQADVEIGRRISFENEDGQFFQVNFIAEPGSRFSVEAIRLEGNVYFSDETIYEEIGISSAGFFRRGVVSPRLIDEAAQTITGMYVQEGFFDTRVTPTEEIDLENGTVTVSLQVEEGRRLEIDDVSYDGNVIIGDDDLERSGNLYPGQIFTPVALRAARRAMTARYYAEGHPEAQIGWTTRELPGDRLAVTFTITEGPAYRVGQVLVAGNVDRGFFAPRTREMVIRRNSESLRADIPYDPQALLQAQRSLYATGLFNRVDIVPLATRNGSRDVLIQVEEAGPLVLTYGVGVKDREGARGTVEISHNNLWGLDRSISFRLRGSRREQRFQTTYREPRLFNWELDGFASLFVERTRREFFDADRIDFSIQTLKQFRATDSFLVSASYQTVNLKDIRLNRHIVNFPDEVGIIQIARVGTSFIHDSRRREDQVEPINPNRGNYFTGSFQLADHALGSEVNFTSFYGQASIYRPWKRATLAASVRFGWNQPYGNTVALPITERYFAGGSTTLRAFGQDEAGPEGGGNALVLLNAEYRYPIPFLFSGLGGALFYDTGTVFPRISDFSVGDFTHTAGLGLRYETPVGPIRFDIGFNLNRQVLGLDPYTEEPHHTIHITLGHAF